MSSSLTKGVVSVMLLALGPTSAQTQTQFATLFGIVTDSTGAVLPGVEVQASNLDTRLARDTTTDIMGRYQLVGLPERYSHGLSLQASYTLSYSIDDALQDDPLEAVNEPPSTQNVFNRKEDRGAQNSTSDTILS